MLDPELLKKIKRIQFRAGHLVTESLAGEYQSAFKGKGMEFDEVREYVPGDDVRTIDWNVTARMNAPFVKIFREERELQVMLMVDVSASQFFSSVEKSKQEMAAEFAAILAYLATRNNDKVGLILFSDQIELYIPAKKGRGHIWRIIQEVLSHKSKGQRTDVGGAMEFFLSVSKRRCMCFMMSDFIDDNYQNQLKHISRKHDLVCVNTSDQRESEIPRIGLTEFQDPETGERVFVDTSSRAFKNEYQKYRADHMESWKTELRRQKVDTIFLKTNEDVVKPLENFLRRRERRQVR